MLDSLTLAAVPNAVGHAERFVNLSLDAWNLAHLVPTVEPPSVGLVELVVGTIGPADQPNWLRLPDLPLIRCALRIEPTAIRFHVYMQKPAQIRPLPLDDLPTRYPCAQWGSAPGAVWFTLGVIVGPHTPC